ncbi:TrmH family RNA methyltransferase [Spongiivirga citrea]|uniref:TrmH family RNA methyltransferase n=2 Tax=Spongiivirga citrea TaxID=1481457 RepID=A0A6M0CDP0_9FLAO|nr:TrmH family RNA methyltransferase [Spongiivirga citrea]
MPANIGSLFRIADAFGVSKLLFGNATIDFNSKRILRTARATINHIEHACLDNIEDEISNLVTEDYQLIAIEITENSIPLSSFNIDLSKKIALIVGAENFGVSEAVLRLVHTTVHIDMYGHNSSMNVTQATGIALYELSKQLVSATS